MPSFKINITYAHPWFGAFLLKLFKSKMSKLMLYFFLASSFAVKQIKPSKFYFTLKKTIFAIIIVTLYITQYLKLFVTWINCNILISNNSNILLLLRGLSWSWLYGSWIYNYLCNQCLSPLMLRVRIPLGQVSRYNIMW